MKDRFRDKTNERYNRDTLSRYKCKFWGKWNPLNSRYLYIQEKYLKEKIFYLEKLQIAESIKAIADVKMTKGKDMLVELIFDSSVTKKTALIKKSFFEELNKLREVDLLRIFEKGKEVKTENSIQRMCPGHKFTLKKIQKLSKVRKRNWSEELKNWAICHHCRKILHISCIYKCSKKMRSNASKKLTMDKKYKNLIGSFLCEVRKDNKVNCEKRFCASCLRNNYDESHLVVFKWVCPSCKGHCFCIRCQRRDILNKFYLYYLKNGGTKTVLKYDSPLLKIIEIIIDLYVEGKVRKRSRNYVMKKKKSNLRIPEKLSERRDFLQKLHRQNTLRLNLIKEVKNREQVKRELFEVNNNIFEKQLERVRRSNIQTINLVNMSQISSSSSKFDNSTEKLEGPQKLAETKVKKEPESGALSVYKYHSIGLKESNSNENLEIGNTLKKQCDKEFEHIYPKHNKDSSTLYNKIEQHENIQICMENNS